MTDPVAWCLYTCHCSRSWIARTNAERRAIETELAIHRAEHQRVWMREEITWATQR